MHITISHGQGVYAALANDMNPSKYKQITQRPH